MKPLYPIPKLSSLFVFGLTLNLADTLTIIGVLLPALTGIGAYIVGGKLKDEQLSNSINLLTLKLEQYIQFKEKDIEEFRGDFREVKDEIRTVKDDIVLLKINAGILPDRRKQNE